MPVKKRDIPSECQEENAKLKAEVTSLKDEITLLEERTAFLNLFWMRFPSPSSVTDTDMRWTFVNRAAEVTRGLLQGGDHRSPVQGVGVCHLRN